MDFNQVKSMLCQTLDVESSLVLSYHSEEDLLNWLSSYIDDLVVHDFNGLLLLLYRIDVSESRVREVLELDQAKSYSSRIIAELILERQKEKLYWRDKFKNYTKEIDDDERW